MPPKFDKSRCKQPKAWCGKSKTIPDGYKKGTRYTCLKQGIGAGMSIEKNKHLPVGSLQRITYIGDHHEQNFRKARILTTKSLVSKAQRLTTDGIKTWLNKVLVKKNGTKDQRAINSVLLFLYESGVRHTPSCTLLKN